MILSIINKLKNTSSTNDKLKLLQKHKSNELLKRVFKLAYNKKIRFGIKKVPEYSQFYGDGVFSSLVDALDILEYEFATRNITGNAAIDKLKFLLSNLCDDDAQVLEMIIRKDLDCNVAVKSINKVWSGTIPDQPQFLAASFNEKNVSKITYPAYVQLKADGSRCMCLYTYNFAEYTTRNSNTFTGLDFIDRDIKAALLKHDVENVMIDGELIYIYPNGRMATREFSNGKASQALDGTLSEEDMKNMRFLVWDIVDLDTYYSDNKDKTIDRKPYIERLALIEKLFGGRQYSNVAVIPTQVVNSRKEAIKVFETYLAMGLEGTIAKNMYGVWMNSRTTDQVKFKAVIDADLEIVAVVPHSKDENKAGAFIVRSRDNLILCNTGSGMTDTTHTKDKEGNLSYIPLDERDELDREYIMAHEDDYIGSIVELECNTWTEDKKNKSGQVSLFLPIIKAVRKDKDTSQTFIEIFGETLEEARERRKQISDFDIASYFNIDVEFVKPKEDEIEEAPTDLFSFL